MKFTLSLWKKYSYLILIIFILGGLFDLRIGLIAIVCMIGPIITSLVKGRFWCGNLCPRGSFYDNLVLKFSKKKKVPALLKSVYFRTIITLLMLTMFTTGMVKNLGNLYGMGMVVYRLIVVTTIVGVGLALFYSNRTWCNFCPMGSMAALISYFKNEKNKNSLLQVDKSCVSCKICEKNCPMDIAPYDFKDDVLSHPDCIQCNNCVYACPKNSINYNSENEEQEDISRVA